MFYKVPPLFPPHMKDGMTALMYAAMEGYLETVTKLIDSGACIDTTDKVSMCST